MQIIFSEELQSLLKIENLIKDIHILNNKKKMKDQITISRQEYEELKKYKEVDVELLTDIANGIRDILKGNVEEV